MSLSIEGVTGFTFLNKARRRLKTYRLRRRRGKATRRRATGRKLTIALSLILLGLFAGFALAQSYISPSEEGRELTLNQLLALAKERRVVETQFLDQDKQITGTFVAEPILQDRSERTKKDGRGRVEQSTNASSGKGKPGPDQDGGKRARRTNTLRSEQPTSRAPSGSGTFRVSYPTSDVLSSSIFDSLIGARAEVTIDPQTSKSVARTVSQYLLPLMILATFFGLLFSAGRGGGGGIGEVMTFGTVGKGRRQRKGSNVTTFADVAGANEAVAELHEVVDYLRDPERYEEVGAVPPKGVLLFGPPGCGKTLISRAVAGEAGVPFFSVAGAEFVESLVGVGAARVRDLFARVRAVAPAIVFIDELDAAGRLRGHGGGSGGSDEREQTLNQMLVEMDGFEVSTGIVVIGATNRPDILDPALLRPGRFDRHIVIDQPDAHGRQEILDLHAHGKRIGDDVDFQYLAKRTPGFSGADLANVINEAALLSIRENKQTIGMVELNEAVQRVLHGPKRKGRVLLPEERERAAFHESGHAVVAAAVGEAEEVHRISILSRGRGIASTGIHRDADRTLCTRSQVYAQLITTMGGLVAEEMMFGEPSTGAENDLEKATELARDMVGRYGFSQLLGPVRLLVSDAEQFLSNDSGVSNLAAATHESMDKEIKRVVLAAKKDALELISQHKEALTALAERLKVEESIEGAELQHLLTNIDAVRAPIRGPFGSSNGAGPFGSEAKTETQSLVGNRSSPSPIDMPSDES